MSDEKKNHILSVSANLLGICFVLITGLRITRNDLRTYADEICIVAAFVLLVSCFSSYLSIRSNGKLSMRFERVADYCFIFGMMCIFCAMVVFSTGF